MNQPSEHPSTNDDTEQGPARDRFVDSLLVHRFNHNSAATDALVERVMRTIEDSRSTRATRWQWWALPAAALVTVALLVMPSNSSASAIVRSAAQAALRQADRQYQVTLIPVSPPDGATPPPLLALLDVRDADHIRVEITHPNGDKTIRARDGEVSWRQEPDGIVRIDERDAAMPRWLETPSGSLLVESMASMLDGLDASYELTRSSDADDCGSGITHITAVNTKGAAPRERPSAASPAQVIELCIDPRTNETIRLEMTFANPQAHRRGEPDEMRPPPHDDMPPPPPHHADFADGPPERDRPVHAGRRPAAPPRTLIFERTATDSFPVDWFAAPVASATSKPE